MRFLKISILRKECIHFKSIHETYGMLDFLGFAFPAQLKESPPSYPPPYSPLGLYLPHTPRLFRRSFYCDLQCFRTTRRIGVIFLIDFAIEFYSRYFERCWGFPYLGSLLISCFLLSWFLVPWFLIL